MKKLKNFCSYAIPRYSRKFLDIWKFSENLEIWKYFSNKSGTSLVYSCNWYANIVIYASCTEHTQMRTKSSQIRLISSRNKSIWHKNEKIWLHELLWQNIVCGDFLSPKTNLTLHWKNFVVCFFWWKAAKGWDFELPDGNQKYNLQNKSKNYKTDDSSHFIKIIKNFISIVA